MLEGILVGIIDASLLRKAMQSCSGVDNWGGEYPGDINGAGNVCKTLNLADEATSEIEVLAKTIIVLARQAERNAAPLRDRALRDLATPQSVRRLVRTHSLSLVSWKRLQARDPGIGEE